MGAATCGSTCWDFLPLDNLPLCATATYLRPATYLLPATYLRPATTLLYSPDQGDEHRN